MTNYAEYMMASTDYAHDAEKMLETGRTAEAQVLATLSHTLATSAYVAYLAREELALAMATSQPVDVPKET